jgi:hypothetical protein
MKPWQTGDFDRNRAHPALHPFMPAHAVGSLAEINAEHLWQRGKRLILLDVDHTLVMWRAEDFAPEILAWIDEARRLGFEFCIISNTRKVERLKRLSERLKIPTVRARFKPSRAMFRLALAKFKCPAANAIMIGDQLMTDILGANRAGIDAIWVNKMDGPEFVGTRVNRFVESILKGFLYRTLVIPENHPTVIPGRPDPAERTIVQQLFRFAIVGGSSFVIDTVLTYMLMRGWHVGGRPGERVVGEWLLAHQPQLFAFASSPNKAAAPLLGGMASFVAMFNSFLWNRAWTFEAKGKDRKSVQVRRFYMVAIPGALLNSALFGLFYNILAGHTIIIAKVLAALISAVWNFAGQRYFAFRGRTP